MSGGRSRIDKESVCGYTQEDAVQRRAAILRKMLCRDGRRLYLRKKCPGSERGCAECVLRPVRLDTV